MDKKKQIPVQLNTVAPFKEGNSSIKIEDLNVICILPDGSFIPLTKEQLISLVGGGGNASTLQAVLTAGNTANIGIDISKINDDSLRIGVRKTGMVESGAFLQSNGVLGLFNMIAEAIVGINNLTESRTFELPDENGTLATRENTIPLTGTLEDFPISGELRAVAYASKGTIYVEDGTEKGALLLDIDRASLRLNTGEEITEINTFPDRVAISCTDESSRGLTGTQDFTLNITELDFTQKKYVDTIRPYKVYTALLTQEGTSNPIPTVLENTIGEINFVRDGVGAYRVLSPGSLFTINKVAFIIGERDGADANPTDGFMYTSMSENTVTELKFFFSTIFGPGADNNMHSRYIEIRVYN